MPGPVSRTDTWNEPLFASALMAISPASVNLMALPTRLISTCVKRRPSARPEGHCGAASTLNPSFLSAVNGSRFVLAGLFKLAAFVLDFVEQSHVLDGNRGLVGEGLNQRDLLVGERFNLRFC